MIVCFEGVNGCGKSCQIELLSAALKKHGLPVVTFFDPGIKEGDPCQVVRKYFKASPPRHPLTSVAVACAMRCELDAEVKRAQRENPDVTVLLDRYYFSTLVYQSLQCREATHEDSDQIVIDCVRPFSFLPIDWLIVLDAEPELFCRRLLDDTREKDQYEDRGRAFLAAVRAKYFTLASDLAEGRHPFSSLVSNVQLVDVRSDLSAEDIFGAYADQVVSSITRGITLQRAIAAEGGQTELVGVA